MVLCVNENLLTMHRPHRRASCSRTDPFVTAFMRAPSRHLSLELPLLPAAAASALAAPHSTNGPRRPSPPPLRAAIRRCVPACNPRPPPGAPRSLAGCSGAGEGGARRLHGRRDGRGEGDAADALVVAGRADDGHRVVDAGAGACRRGATHGRRSAASSWAGSVMRVSGRSRVISSDAVTRAVRWPRLR